MRPESGFRMAAYWPYITKKKYNVVKMYRHDVIVIFFFFLHCRVSLVNFSYWFKFHVNIMTGSGVMIRNTEIGNTPV